MLSAGVVIYDRVAFARLSPEELELSAKLLIDVSGLWKLAFPKYLLAIHGLTVILF